MSQLRARLLELDTAIQEAGNAAERAGNSYQAHMQLFNVAAGNNDEKTMEEHRLALHTMLDVILDTGINVARMSNERQGIVLKLWHGQ